jgi:hypothetical protein
MDISQLSFEEQLALAEEVYQAIATSKCDPQLQAAEEIAVASPAYQEPVPMQVRPWGCIYVCFSGCWKI